MNLLNQKCTFPWANTSRRYSQVIVMFTRRFHRFS